MKIALIIAIVLAACLIGLFAGKAGRSSSKKEFSRTTQGISGRPILSAPEMTFYKQLCRSLPQYVVFPQVAVNAILEVDKSLQWKKRNALRNQYGQWHVDFAICEPETLSIVGIAEYDGKDHDAKNDAWRDEVLEQGGYKVHRFPASKKYSDSDIAAAFGHTVSQIPVLSAPSSTETQF